MDNFNSESAQRVEIRSVNASQSSTTTVPESTIRVSLCL
jgi:hypothetical protein